MITMRRPVIKTAELSKNNCKQVLKLCPLELCILFPITNKKYGARKIKLARLSKRISGPKEFGPNESLV
jgi:hypothetical protein